MKEFGSEKKDTIPETNEADEIDYRDRIFVPEDKRSWEVNWPEYNPPSFTSEWVRTTGVELGVTDPDSPFEIDFSEQPSWGPTQYEFDEEGYPLHPEGRQGIAGLGDVGEWGPKKAGDVMIVKPEECKVLLIRRKREKPEDVGQWALPGGMVDPGEHIDDTIIREGEEETGIDLLALGVPGTEVYRGPSGDPRDTDNCWIETKAKRFNVDSSVVAVPADDAVDAQWFDARSMEHLMEDIRAYDEAQGVPHQPIYARHGAIIARGLGYE